MTKDHDNIERLKKHVVQSFKLPVNEHADYENLMIDIENKTHRSISTSTLKRVFGYLKSKSNPSKYTLDTLAMYSGFENWHKFVTMPQSEHSPAENKAFFNAVKKAMNIMELDSSGKIIFVNTLMLKWMGKKKFEVVGRHISEILDFENDTKSENFWNDLKGGEVKKLVYPVQEEDDDAMWLVKTFTPIKNKKGEVSKILVVSVQVMENEIDDDVQSIEKTNAKTL